MPARPPLRRARTIASVLSEGGPGGGFRLLVWQVAETAGFEAAWLRLDGLALCASGQAAGQLPEPYLLTYELQTDDRAVTTRLEVTATLAGAQHGLDLRREHGSWTVNGEVRPDLAPALDCDLGFSPVTNTMPVIRHGLHRGPGTEQFLMAWVEVPALRVIASEQAYTHLGMEPRGARVRFTSGSYTRDLLLDGDGLVIDYPTMATRMPVPPVAATDQRPGA
jgi:uncharacterized protein